MKYRKKTDAHIREYARVAAGSLDIEQRERMRMIMAHRQMERDKMDLRHGLTRSMYDTLELRGGLSSRASMRPSLTHSASMGSLASRPATSGSLPVSGGSCLSNAISPEGSPLNRAASTPGLYLPEGPFPTRPATVMSSRPTTSPGISLPSVAHDSMLWSTASRPSTTSPARHVPTAYRNIPASYMISKPFVGQ